MSQLEIHTDVDLSVLNTFGLPAIARFYTRPSSTEELEAAFNFAGEKSIKTLVLGGGSNLLFKAEIFDGLIIHLNLNGIEITETESDYSVAVNASENWHQFVRFCAAQDIKGIENLSLIPGSVGASPVQNIGAYGVEVGEFIQSVDCYDPNSKQLVSVEKSECKFSYRDSIFKHEFCEYVIVKVCFSFPKTNQFKLSYGDLQARVARELETGKVFDALLVSDVVCEIRSEKLPDPNILGNAGSFFKNPIVSCDVYQALKGRFPSLVAFPYSSGYKLAAGWMIDQLGLKGVNVGGAAVHDKQALVLVNQSGSATSSELFALVSEIKAKVLHEYGVVLEIEPVIIE